MSKSLTFQGLNQSPNSIEAEIAVLGGLILDNEAWEKIADILTENDFYNHEHRKIYSCIVDLIDQNIPFDVVTINEKVNISNDKSFSIYLSEIIDQTPSAANIKAYANIVREQSILRQLINVSNALIEKSKEGGIDSKALLDEAEQKIFNISEESLKANSGFQNINQLVKDSLVEIQNLWRPAILITFTLVITGLAIGLWTSRLLNIDVITTILGAAPGGISGMSLVGSEYGVGAAVATLHAVRLITVLLILPLVVKCLNIFGVIKS